MTAIKKSNERDAARVNLRTMLNSKKRGDHITAVEIVESTGFDDWELFRRHIRHWADESGFVLDAIPNEGYRVVLADDHVVSAVKDRKAATRKLARGVRKLATAPVAELSDRAMKRYERELLSSGRLLALAVEDERSIRRDFKIAQPKRERMPALASGDRIS